MRYRFEWAQEMARMGASWAWSMGRRRRKGVGELDTGFKLLALRSLTWRIVSKLYASPFQRVNSPL
jgi:hypothetical protein